jgi:hypothetical protein
MAEFKRSRLVRNAEEQITKKTVVLGFLTVISFVLIIIFGLPFLVKFSIFLGETKSSKEKNVKEVVLPPLAPRLVLPFEATNSGVIAIKGLAEANVTVELLKNEVSIGKTQVTPEGDFVFEGVELNKGENAFNAIAMTEMGGSSEISKTANVVYDDQPPELTLLNPNADSITVDKAEYEVSGNTEKGASVLINGHVGMVDDNGKFKLKIQLSSGKNDVEIVAQDLAKNQTKKTVVITYDM